MSANQRFHDVANDALVNISEQLWPGAKLCLVIYTKDKPGLDIVLTDLGIDLDQVLSTLRRKPMSIDGTNTYKRDLCDCIVGALAFGKQGRNRPPEGHWLERFWELGRAEGELQECLVRAAKTVLAGLNDRIDAAVADRSPSPVFDGIAALHDAIGKATS